MVSEARRKYYHMSKRKLPVGTTLVPSGRPPLWQKIEDALEERRPAEMLSRTAAVYLTRTLDFELYGLVRGYVYEVQPEGRPQEHDVHWIGQLQRSSKKHELMFPTMEYMDWTKKTLDYLCAHYWFGEAGPKPIWEFLVPSAVITKALWHPRQPDVMDTLTAI